MLKSYSSSLVVIRVFSLWVTGLAIMFILWALSYRELPEGVLHDKFLVSMLDFTTPNKAYILLEILGYNLLLVVVPILISNLFRVKDFPIGYLLTLYHWGLYGLFLGTNSFYFPSILRPVPSVENLLSGVGFYEISSYTIIAASTYSLYSNRIGLNLIQNLNRQDRFGLIIGFIILFLSNLFETWII